MTAAQLVASLQRMHARLRDSVDLMGIGLAAPKGDTVAEDASAGAKSAGEQGDVRRAAAAWLLCAPAGRAGEAGGLLRLPSALLLLRPVLLSLPAPALPCCPPPAGAS